MRREFAMLMEQTLQTLKTLRLPGMAAAFEEQHTHAASAAPDPTKPPR